MDVVVDIYGEGCVRGWFLLVFLDRFFFLFCGFFVLRLNVWCDRGVLSPRHGEVNAAKSLDCIDCVALSGACAHRKGCEQFGLLVRGKFGGGFCEMVFAHGDGSQALTFFFDHNRCRGVRSGMCGSTPLSRISSVPFFGAPCQHMERGT